MKRNMKTIIISVFICIYVLSMAAATVFASFYRKNEMDHERVKYSVSLVSFLSSSDQTRREMKSEGITGTIMGYQAYLTELLAMHSDRYQQISAAFYDMEGNKLAQTGSLLGIQTSSVRKDSQMTATNSFYYDAGEYLSREELEQLGEYLEQNEKTDRQHSPEPYRISIRVRNGAAEENYDPDAGYDDYDPQKTALTDLAVQKITWSDMDRNPEAEVDSLTGAMWSEEIPVYRNIDSEYEGYIQEDDVDRVLHYQQTDDEVVFTWTDGQGEAGGWEVTDWDSISTAMFPGLKEGYREWLSWMDHTYLHQFPDKILDMETALDRMYSGEGKTLEETSGIGFEADRWNRTLTCYPVVMADSDAFYEEKTSGSMTLAEPYYYLFVAAETHPVRSAVHMLRFVYLGSCLFILACMFLVLYVIQRTAGKREQMEEGRRDFTNAVAHELKTPLGITRAFAENLAENTAEEKREYYVEQIIRQTEEMDRLVLDMIDASKLDSDLLVLQKEIVSLNELLDTQLKKLEPAAEQKNLTVERQDEAEFTVVGDPKYLEKAVWNLLVNAVVHNRQNGSISIRIRKNELILENTVIPDQGESSGEQNTGIGLYLTEKILEKHHLYLNMEMKEDGTCCSFRLWV
ncbi:MAG: sensor histidine kinase [Lachnospiraceae bacterium]